MEEQKNNVNENITTEHKKGILLREADIMQWTQEQYVSFFLFADFFYKEDGAMIVTREKVEAVIQYADSSPFFAEMLERIDRPMNEYWNKTSDLSFRMRFTSLARVFKSALIKKPHLLQPEIVAKQKNKPQYTWLRELYRKDNTPKSTFIERVPSNLNPDFDSEQAQPVVAPSSVLIEAMERVAGIYNTIAKSITEKEIKSLDVKDRLNALQKLSYIHATTKKFKPNVRILKIKTNNSDRDSMEAALLDFNNEEDSE